MLIKTVIFVVIVAFGIVLPAWWLSYIGKILLGHIIVRRKGEKQIGICKKYISGRNGGLEVQWNDGKRNHHMIFYALPVKLRYPYEIKIYSLNNLSNLGLPSIIPYLIYFLLFLLVFVVCAIGSVDIILDIFRYL